MAQVTWTDEARGWLQEIYDYIARDSPDAAYRVVTEIHDRAETMAQFPQMGARFGTAATSAFSYQATIESPTSSSPMRMSIFSESFTARWR